MTWLRLGFARWVSDVPSGGNRYDDRLAAGLRDLGVDVREYAVAGPWPMVGAGAQRAFAEVLARESDWLVDNILAAGAPEAIAAARAAGRRVTVLVHYLPADELGWTAAEREQLTAAEKRALAAATLTVATSGWTADQVVTRYGLPRSVVAVPGVHPAPLASGSGPPRLIWLGRVTRTKDPLTLVRALASLAHLDWTARVIGPDTLDPPYTVKVRTAVENVGVADRITLPGARTGEDLEAEWAASDLLVLTSRVEPYGMVVTEARARGIPSVVTAGTGAVEAQSGVGTTFPAGHADALATVLRRWLTDPNLRTDWRRAAAEQRPWLPTWRATAEAVLAALDRPSSSR